MTDRPRSIDEEEARRARHELRTPLNQIIGYSEMLREEATDRGETSTVADLQKIEAAARRLCALVDRYFDPARAAAETAAAPNGAAVAPSADDRPEPEPAEPAVRQGEGGRLLVVDDDAANRDMLARRLRRSGYDVGVACDGSEALAAVERQPFDLVLLDWMMPGLSGIDVLDRLRQRFSVSDLPVIMATAMGQSDDIVLALKHGANDYVTKPLDYQVVQARVETQLSLKHAKDRIAKLAHELEIRNRFIQKTFGRYLSHEVVASLLDSPEGLRLGGEKRHVTILMSDLRGFTSVSERVSPEQVVAILNNYLGEMAEIILSYGGTIDEFIGDAVLAVFGAPESHPDDAERAVACALAMQLGMGKVNEENRRHGLPEIEMGIAAHTGEVVVGNIGSHKRAKYGIVGSHVNLAARIESFTVGGQILISESTRDEAGPAVRVEGQIAVRAKGFSGLITAFDLRGIGGDHELQLPDRSETLVTLPRGLPVEYALVEEKHVEAAAREGMLMRLSPRGAEIRTSSPPPLLCNVQIRMFTEEGQRLPGDVYAKVVDRVAGSGDWFVVTFTSTPPEAHAYLRELYARGGAEQP